MRLSWSLTDHLHRIDAYGPAVPVVSLDELLAAVRSPALAEGLLAAGGGWLRVDVGAGQPLGVDDRPRLAAVPAVLVAVADDAAARDRDVAGAFDVVVADDGAAATVTAAVDANPIAATALALLLRGSDKRSVAEGLIAESSTYSMLQAGAEHQAWLAGRARRVRPPSTEPPVRVARDRDRLGLTLNRPDVRNAFDAATRDALLEGLAVAAADPTIVEVVLAGEGPSFCSGGDLDEFGSATDPGAAHVLRLARSAGWAIHGLADRVTARVHGACIGAGVELPAFARRVVAHTDATFSLPEVGMGLVPGAGGTVSITGRIGRHRTVWLALTGEAINATTALEWGLVDELADERR